MDVRVKNFSDASKRVDDENEGVHTKLSGRPPESFLDEAWLICSRTQPAALQLTGEKFRKSTCCRGVAARFWEGAGVPQQCMKKHQNLTLIYAEELRGPNEDTWLQQ